MLFDALEFLATDGCLGISRRKATTYKQKKRAITYIHK